jgi:hypothetical protein
MNFDCIKEFSIVKWNLHIVFNQKIKYNI